MAMGTASTTLKRATLSESNMADISNSVNKLIKGFKSKMGKDGFAFFGRDKTHKGI
jgi:hypothetical protein